MAAMTVALPPAARRVREGVLAAVRAAGEHDRDALHEQVTLLAAAAPQQVRGLLHVIVLGLMEDAHPDGLDADDVRALLDALLKDTAPWLPNLDPHAVVLVLSGVLSVQEDDAPPMDYSALLAACAVLVAHLLVDSPLPLADLLDQAFGELHRAQTMELP